MQYCIKLDIGKAMSAFLVRWQMEEEFKNTIIYLSDFPFCKKTGKLLGKWPYYIYGQKKRKKEKKCNTYLNKTITILI